jgi:predicted amidohydrolase
VRKAAVDAAALVVTPTALGEDWGVVAHRVIPTRAFENCLYVAYANFAGSEGGSRYLGASVIAGPRGDDSARAAAREELIVSELYPEAISRARDRLPFLRDHVGL